MKRYTREQSSELQDRIGNTMMFFEYAEKIHRKLAASCREQKLKLKRDLAKIRRCTDRKGKCLEADSRTNQARRE